MECALYALVVDPSKTSQKLVMNMLSRLGIASESSDGTGDQVFHLVRKSLIDIKNGKKTKGFDIVLMPYLIDEFNASQTAQYLRKLGYEGLIILAFGDITKDEAIHFRDYGADAAIAKPITMDSLLIGLKGTLFYTMHSLSIV